MSTGLLIDWMRPAPNSRTEPSELDHLLHELRCRAGRLMRGERCGHTLQPTALVHEAFVRLMGSKPVTCGSRNHFLALVTRTMQRILVDFSRRRMANKRGKGKAEISWQGAELELAEPEVDPHELRQALRCMAETSPRQARVVVLRFWQGLTQQETADLLGVSVATIKLDWQFARAWLYQWLATIPRDSGEVCDKAKGESP